jgi:rhamnosyltransferase
VPSETVRDDVALCIPTLNAGRWVDRLVPALANQRVLPRHIVVIDSSSTDGSVERFAALDADIVRIPRERFDHGGTRNLVFDRVPAAVYVFLTQDAIPSDDEAIGRLVTGLLADPCSGVAYGRQLPRDDAGPLARAHRAFNYPPEPVRRTAADIGRLGVRAAFSSNSFCAYRREAIDDVCRFPQPVVGSEDHYVAARMLEGGWAITYVPDACVEHSHDYTLAQQFHRYFDIGVFQASRPWFREFLGGPEREGRRLLSHQRTALRAGGVRFAGGRVLVRGAASWLGFRLGRAHRRLPRAACVRWSTSPAYWNQSDGQR